MRRYLVESGNNQTIVEAADHDDAFELAFAYWLDEEAKEGESRTFGILASVIEVAEPDPHFIATEAVLKRIGVSRVPVHPAARDFPDGDFAMEGDCPDCEGTGEVCCNCDDQGCSLCIDGMRTCMGCDGSGFQPCDDPRGDDD